MIEQKTGYETRSVNLGHTQRGGTPTAYDRMLATRYGTAAIDLVHQGNFGRLVVLAVRRSPAFRSRMRSRRRAPSVMI